LGSGFRVWVWGLEFRVQGSEFRGWNFGSWGLGFRVLGLGFRVKGFRVEGLGLRIWSLGFRVQGLVVGVWGLGFGVQGLGFGVQVLELRFSNRLGVWGMEWVPERRMEWVPENGGVEACPEAMARKSGREPKSWRTNASVFRMTAATKTPPPKSEDHNLQKSTRGNNLSMVCDEGGEARRVEWVPENGGVKAVEVQQKKIPVPCMDRKAHVVSLSQSFRSQTSKVNKDFRS